MSFDDDATMNAIGIMVFLFGLAVTALIVYVLAHFIVKWW
jgi:phage shock protein PspC (stress-responsive transcriptional regulator)